MSVVEMAETYYPRLWSKDRIKSLVEAGRLTREEAEEIMGTTREAEEAPPLQDEV